MSKVTCMTLGAIKKEYPDEWVLIEYEKIDDDFHVKTGRVVAHSPVKEEIYKVLMKMKNKNIAIEYTGEIPDDLAVMF